MTEPMETISNRTAKGLPLWTLSLIVPGWGQMCQYRVATGLLWLALAIALSWAWSYPTAGVWAHVLCVLDAFGARNRAIVPYGRR